VVNCEGLYDIIGDKHWTVLKEPSKCMHGGNEQPDTAKPMGRYEEIRAIVLLSNLARR
jgi:hypothetical protein